MCVFAASYALGSVGKLGIMGCVFACYALGVMVSFVMSAVCKLLWLGVTVKVALVPYTYIYICARVRVRSGWRNIIW